MIGGIIHIVLIVVMFDWHKFDGLQIQCDVRDRNIGHKILMAGADYQRFQVEEPVRSDCLVCIWPIRMGHFVKL